MGWLEPFDTSPSNIRKKTPSKSLFFSYQIIPGPARIVLDFMFKLEDTLVYRYFSQARNLSREGQRALFANLTNYAKEKAEREKTRHIATSLPAREDRVGDADSGTPVDREAESLSNSG